MVPAVVPADLANLTCWSPPILPHYHDILPDGHRWRERVLARALRTVLSLFLRPAASRSTPSGSLICFS